MPTVAPGSSSSSPVVRVALGVAVAALAGTAWLVLRPASTRHDPPLPLAPSVADSGQRAATSPDAGRQRDPEVPCTETRIYLERAERAEREKDWEDALDSWERVLDACPSTPEEREEARRRAAPLREKVDVPVAPHQWKLLAVLVQRTEVEWTGDDGRDAVLRAELSDENQEQVREALASLEKRVSEWTSGRVQLVWRLELVGETQRQFEPVRGKPPFHSTPGTLGPASEAARRGEQFDSVFVYVKTQEHADGDALPLREEVQSLDPSQGPQGAFWTDLAIRVQHDPSGEVELREWLGQVQWRLRNRRGFPKDLLPPLEGPDPDFEARPGERSALRYFQHLMRDHVTRRVWERVARTR